MSVPVSWSTWLDATATPRATVAVAHLPRRPSLATDLLTRNTSLPLSSPEERILQAKRPFLIWNSPKGVHSSKWPKNTLK